ncbi:MAG: PASTA domain-containing protein [Flavobacteriales bacterium]|nr:PASTA domain-containing protein [Flavobacteriales bacterium]
MGFIKFIFSKLFLINLGIAVGLSIPVTVGLYFWLDFQTEHGITVETPNLTGLKLKDLEAMADTLEVELVVVDSLYSDDFPRGTVADQDPKPGLSVKRGRKIYLTVNAMLPKQVVVPDVKNLSLRQAKAVLESVGLKLGGLEYQPDIAKNAVLQQKIRGKVVKKGTLAFSGTVVDLVLGDGLSNTRVLIPYLIHYTLQEAMDRLNLSSLNLATFKIDDPFTDSTKVRVYKQVPAFSENNLVPMGTSVIIYLTEDTLSIQYDSTLYALPVLLGDSILNEETINEEDF